MDENTITNQEIQVQKPPVSFFNREPVMIAAAIRAILYVAVLYGFDMSPDQMVAIVAAVESVLALITRQQVTPFVPAGSTPNISNPVETPSVEVQNQEGASDTPQG